MTAANDHPSAPVSAARRSTPAIIRFLLTALLLLGADLLVKHLSFERVAGAPVSLERDASGQLPPIPPHEGVTLIPKVLALELTLNHGAVFGIGQGQRTLFVMFTVVATVIIGGLFLRSGARQIVFHLCLAAVLAGALGNLFDRIFVGAVRDMFHLFPGVDLPFGWHWPDGSSGLYPWIFNVADVCLVCGIIALIVIMHRADRAKVRIARRDAAAANAG